jgi:hypothetical protein
MGAEATASNTIQEIVDQYNIGTFYMQSNTYDTSAIDPVIPGVFFTGNNFNCFFFFFDLLYYRCQTTQTHLRNLK